MEAGNKREPGGYGYLLQGTCSHLVVLTLAAMMLACGPPSMIGHVHAASGRSAGPINTARLAGTWVRPDGGSFPQLKEIKTDGSLKAAYYNRRPINVGRAELRNQG